MLPFVRHSDAWTGNFLLLWYGMTLSDYLGQCGETRRAFAKKIGVSHTAVQHWISGYRTPRRANMLAIHVATEGSVRPDDFVLQLAAK
jgi:hypothetical protein